MTQVYKLVPDHHPLRIHQVRTISPGHLLCVSSTNLNVQRQLLGRMASALCELNTPKLQDASKHPTVLVIQSNSTADAFATWINLGFKHHENPWLVKVRSPDALDKIVDGKIDELLGIEHEICAVVIYDVGEVATETLRKLRLESVKSNFCTFFGHTLRSESCKRLGLHQIKGMENRLINEVDASILINIRDGIVVEKNRHALLGIDSRVHDINDRRFYQIHYNERVSYDFPYINDITRRYMLNTMLSNLPLLRSTGVDQSTALKIEAVRGLVKRKLSTSPELGSITHAVKRYTLLINTVATLR